MSPEEEIYIIEETLRGIKQQAKKSGAKPPHSILVKMIGLENRLKELQDKSDKPKERPVNLPRNLIAVRDAAIDYALGRVNKLPEDIGELYEWLQIEGMLTSALEEYAIDIEQLAANHFSDYELENPEDNSIDQRLEFAREFINEIFGDESNYIRWICGAWLENNVGEIAIAGTILESHGQAGLVFISTGIYKSIEEFLCMIRESSNLVMESDLSNVSDEKLLNLWND
jgi:hypothetical protein